MMNTQTQATACDHKAFLLQQDQELRRIVLEKWVKHPGLIPNRKTEQFLLSQQFIQDNKNYYRLSPAQKEWMLGIARDQLRIDIPEEVTQ